MQMPGMPRTTIAPSLASSAFRVAAPAATVLVVGAAGHLLGRVPRTRRSGTGVGGIGT